VGWPRGEATDCKSVYTGSNPVPTSTHTRPWAIGAAVARFPDTEEVTGSIPVSPTTTKQPLTCTDAGSGAVVVRAGGVIGIVTATLTPNPLLSRGKTVAIDTPIAVAPAKSVDYIVPAPR
jgi:hypothetical protein